MSKIGRRPIEIAGLKVEIKGQDIHYNGAKCSGVYKLPELLIARMEGNKLFVLPREEGKAGLVREIKRNWGLHRALLANSIHGAISGFEKNIQIVGLGYKVGKSGDKGLTFTLGYSHKIDFVLPDSVSVDIDKTGQKLTVKATDKALVGFVCSKIRALRSPEPYKGTGIKVADEVILRKAGKTKS